MLPEKMRAIRLEGEKRALAVNVPLPKPADEEVLMEVTHCALCRTDAKMWADGHRDLVLPRILGHEFCVRDPNTGDRFLVWPGTACNVCVACWAEKENLCYTMRIAGFHRDGALAQWVAVPRNALIPLLKSAPPPDFAVLAEPLACALNALQQIHLSSHEQLLILGGGSVGLLMALAAQSLDAVPFLVEKDAERLARSEHYRTKLKIDSGDSVPKKASFAAAVNAAPTTETISTCLSQLVPGGRFGFFSGLPSDENLPAAVFNEVHYRQLTVSGAYGCTRIQMRRALDILSRHEDAVELLIDRRVELDEAPAVLADILKRQVMKCVVHIECT